MPKEKQVYQFKITLNEIVPLIWRRIQVPENYSFWDLHVAIQDVMGWLDYHLHAFRISLEDGKFMEIGIPDNSGFQDDIDIIPGWEASLSSFLEELGMAMEYEYDFGDRWRHEILFEGCFSKEQGTKYPRCIGGECACPPEDCGGVGGYYELLKILKKKRGKEYQETMDWLGGKYDPDHFDSDKIRFSNPKKRFQKAFEIK